MGVRLGWWLGVESTNLAVGAGAVDAVFLAHDDSGLVSGRDDRDECVLVRERWFWENENCVYVIIL